MHVLRPRFHTLLAGMAISFLMLSPVSGSPASTPSTTQRLKTDLGYIIPMKAGGSMLTQVENTYPPGLGEPINVILSGNSDPAILQGTVNGGGLINYYQSFGFSTECLGQHSGDGQGANLGDGNGYVNQTAVIRWDYGNVQLGTCQETLEGGNHIRYWTQNGVNANTGAIFMALSYEMPIAYQHNIIVDGYNLGRDWMVGNATAQSSVIPTSTLTNTSTYSGSTYFNGYLYHTTVNYVSGLLQNTSAGVNHYTTVGIDGSNAIDGLVAVMTAKITSRPTQTNSAESSHRPFSLYWMPLVLACMTIASYCCFMP